MWVAAQERSLTTGRHKRITSSGVPCVLVVDDNREVCASLTGAIHALGFRSRSVESGDAALAVADLENPALMLIDLCLPGLSGWDLARRMRASEQRAKARLVAITGLTDSVFRLRSMAAGFDDHLVKPVEVFELKRVLAQIR